MKKIIYLAVGLLILVIVEYTASRQLNTNEKTKLLASGYDSCKAEQQATFVRQSDSVLGRAWLRGYVHGYLDASKGDSTIMHKIKIQANGHK